MVKTVKNMAQEAANYLNEENIKNSLKKLGEKRKKYNKNPVGIYLDIQEHYKKRVAGSCFQEMFNYFYRVRTHLDKNKREKWKKEFFELFRNDKCNRSFYKALKEFHTKVHRVEASFISKMIATVNPKNPVIDSVVLKKFGLKMPTHEKNDEKRLERTNCEYERLKQAYEELQQFQNAKNAISRFDNEFKEESGSITDVKKLDFILWQIRLKDLSKVSNK